MAPVVVSWCDRRVSAALTPARDPTCPALVERVRTGPRIAAHEFSAPRPGRGAVAVCERANFTPRSDASSIVAATLTPEIRLPAACPAESARRRADSTRGGVAMATSRAQAGVRGRPPQPPAGPGAAWRRRRQGRVMSTAHPARALRSVVVVLGVVLGTALSILGAGPVAASDGPQGSDPVGEWPLRPEPEVVADFDPPDSTYGSGHRGVDLGGAAGQQVRTALAGTVSYAGPLAGTGVVVVGHGDTRTTYQPVLASVTVGDVVERGCRARDPRAPPLALLPAGVPALGLDPRRDLPGPAPARRSRPGAAAAPVARRPGRRRATAHVVRRVATARRPAAARLTGCVRDQARGWACW